MAPPDLATHSIHRQIRPAWGVAALTDFVAAFLADFTVPFTVPFSADFTVPFLADFTVPFLADLSCLTVIGFARQHQRYHVPDGQR